MYFTDWTVDLPGTARAWAEAPDADLESELEADLFPLRADLAEGGCENGGGTDDEEVSVSNVRIVDDELHAEIDIYFDEVIPSACRDMPNHEKRLRRLVLRLQRGSTFGYLDLSDSDPQGWSIEDRNSAADGT